MDRIIKYDGNISLTVIIIFLNGQLAKDLLHSGGDVSEPYLVVSVKGEHNGSVIVYEGDGLLVRIVGYGVAIGLGGLVLGQIQTSGQLSANLSLVSILYNILEDDIGNFEVLIYLYPAVNGLFCLFVGGGLHIVFLAAFELLKAFYSKLYILGGTLYGNLYRSGRGPLGAEISLGGQFDCPVNVFTVNSGSAGVAIIDAGSAAAVLDNIGDYFDLSLAAVSLFNCAIPTPVGVASHCKGGSHGENHDQSQSDCENLLHFFKSLSNILCFASDGGFPPGEAPFTAPFRLARLYVTTNCYVRQ